MNPTTNSNMQARDRLGRPLRGERISTDTFPQVPERDAISTQQAWSEITEYRAQGLPFHVHEVAEQRWRCAPAVERDFWRACAQMGAALTHQARGNEIGAKALSVRALATLESTSFRPIEINPIELNSFFTGMLGS